MYDEIIEYMRKRVEDIKADTMTSMGEDMQNAGILYAFEEVKTLIETLKQETK